MAIYFPDFKLMEKSDGEVFWTGKIEVMGEVRITYPQTYPAQKFTIEPLSIMGHYHGNVRLVYLENFSYDPIKVYVLSPALPTTNIHIHMTNVHLKKIREYMNEWSSKGLETGGYVFGKLKPNGVAIVTHVLDGGPKAERTPYLVLFQSEFLKYSLSFLNAQLPIQRDRSSSPLQHLPHILQVNSDFTIW